MTTQEKARKAIDYLQTYLDADAAIAQGKAVDAQAEALANAEPVDTVAQKTTAQNIALAGSGVKRELMGGIDEADTPTTTAKDLEDAGIDSALAEEIISERDTIRADALSLTADVKPIDINPVEEIKP